ncbi:MAG: hypothetical protein HYV68_03620 [Candidatus Taylorbacteria bacterium]|nr:hypothetical protein [Candidatus Taylorbacteria bacterium]
MTTKTKNNSAFLFDTWCLYNQSLTATQNGSALTCQIVPGPWTRSQHYICYRAAPTSGTFSISWSGASSYQYKIFTLQNAAQSSPIDAMYVNDLTSSGSSLTTSTSTSQGSDPLLDTLIGSLDTTHTFGINQTETYMGSFSDPLGKSSASYKIAGTSAANESMSRTVFFSNSHV